MGSAAKAFSSQAVGRVGVAARSPPRRPHSHSPGGFARQMTPPGRVWARLTRTATFSAARLIALHWFRLGLEVERGYAHAIKAAVLRTEPGIAKNARQILLCSFP